MGHKTKEKTAAELAEARYLNIREAARYVGASVTWIRGAVKDGLFPPPIKLPCRSGKTQAHRFPREKIDAWLADLEADSEVGE